MGFVFAFVFAFVGVVRCTAAVHIVVVQKAEEGRAREGRARAREVVVNRDCCEKRHYDDCLELNIIYDIRSDIYLISSDS